MARRIGEVAVSKIQKRSYLAKSLVVTVREAAYGKRRKSPSHC